ncbi:hypothetical protein K461DRAFT_272178 [Myriangium duriaei CBS 260.36]|uniref:Anaphase-promoting complex subunit 4 WD40 domain-containing protein n=1 Tax=Myriangium duriaei CBS 260.36 TaxID=1168546 RepID=A0A9P4IUG9_9PEZI|nr:hypothetical protein K461DRAFT_272178 [Myriangium duriaei CBS 260.36]
MHVINCGSKDEKISEKSGVCFSPDGQLLAAAQGPIVRIWDVDTAYEVQRLETFGHAFFAVSFLPCGQVVAARSSDSILTWNVVAGQGLEELELGSHTISTIRLYSEETSTQSSLYMLILRHAQGAAARTLQDAEDRMTHRMTIKNFNEDYVSCPSVHSGWIRGDGIDRIYISHQYRDESAVQGATVALRQKSGDVAFLRAKRQGCDRCDAK